jgi:hypothetical protein
MQRQDLKILFPNVINGLSHKKNYNFNEAKMELLKNLKFKEKELEIINNECRKNSSLSKKNIEIVEQIFNLNNESSKNEILSIEYDEDIPSFYRGIKIDSSELKYQREESFLKPSLKGFPAL